MLKLEFLTFVKHCFENTCALILNCASANAQKVFKFYSTNFANDKFLFHFESVI